MTDPYRTSAPMPLVEIGQRWTDPIGRAFVITGHCTLDDGGERWLADYVGGNATWIEESDVLQCDRDIDANPLG